MAREPLRACTVGWWRRPATARDLVAELLKIEKERAYILSQLFEMNAVPEIDSLSTQDYQFIGAGSPVPRIASFAEGDPVPQAAGVPNPASPGLIVSMNDVAAPTLEVSDAFEPGVFPSDDPPSYEEANSNIDSVLYSDHVGTHS